MCLGPPLGSPGFCSEKTWPSVHGSSVHGGSPVASLLTAPVYWRPLLSTGLLELPIHQSVALFWLQSVLTTFRGNSQLVASEGTEFQERSRVICFCKFWASLCSFKCLFVEHPLIIAFVFHLKCEEPSWPYASQSKMNDFRKTFWSRFLFTEMRFEHNLHLYSGGRWTELMRLYLHLECSSSPSKGAEHLKFYLQ